MGWMDAATVGEGGLDCMRHSTAAHGDHSAPRSAVHGSRRARPHLPLPFCMSTSLLYGIEAARSSQRTAKAHRRRWQRRQRSWAERRRDRRHRRWLERRRERVARPCTVRKLPHLHRDWAHPSHICTGTRPPVLSAGVRNRILFLVCRLHGREGSHAAHPHTAAAAATAPLHRSTAHTRLLQQLSGRTRKAL